MTRATFPFAADEVVIARDGFITQLDGAEVLVVHKSRHRSSEPIVRARPELFVRDGEVPEPAERPEIPEPEPAPKKPAVKMLRAKRSWISPSSAGYVVALQKGELVAENVHWLGLLSKSLRAELFEKVPQS